MKLKACNRIGLVLAGGWILGAILYTLCTLPLVAIENELANDPDWVNQRLAILALGSVALYLLPFLVRWILKGFVATQI
jgi:hypothetical protein